MNSTALTIGGIVGAVVLVTILVCFVPLSVTSEYQFENPDAKQLALLEQGYQDTVEFIEIVPHKQISCLSVLIIKTRTDAFNASDIEAYFKVAGVDPEFLVNTSFGF